MSERVDRFLSRAVLPGGVLGVTVLFLFAVQLLGAATDAAAPLLERVFHRVADGDSATLGLSWLGAYVLANGSVIAALALSLFAADILTAQQLFLAIAGSRLGAAAIVVFIGVLDYVQKRAYSLQKAVSMGLLTFLLTHSIYVPVTVFGYVGLPYLRGSLLTVSDGWVLGASTPAFVGRLTLAITTRFGPSASFVLAIVVLFGSLKLFDRLLASVDTTTLRQRFFSQFKRTWVSFVIGLVVTTATTSVAFSLGVIVPLYNRGYVERDELIPYVLGANLGTLFDTLVVAIVLDSPVGTAVVLELLLIATLVTLAALAVHDHYCSLIAAVDDRLLEDRRAFVAFVLSLLVGPLALLLVPMALG